MAAPEDEVEGAAEPAAAAGEPDGGPPEGAGVARPLSERAGGDPAKAAEPPVAEASGDEDPAHPLAATVAELPAEAAGMVVVGLEAAGGVDRAAAVPRGPRRAAGDLARSGGAGGSS